MFDMCCYSICSTAVGPPLTPIPVSGYFDRVEVDVIQFPRSSTGNQNAGLVIPLAKWLKVALVPYKSAATIATLRVEEIIRRYAVPTEIFHDKGKALMYVWCDD